MRVIPKRAAGGRQPNGSQSVGTHTKDSRTPQKTFVLSAEEHGLLWGGILTSRFSLTRGQPKPSLPQGH